MTTDHNSVTAQGKDSPVSTQVIRRLIQGFGASALGPVVTLVVQIVSVPIFLHYWGATLYGEWLILSAIPSYLALSDIGFGRVAASDMTMSVAAGKRDAALETFQSTWLLISGFSLALLALVCTTAWLVPWSRWMKLSVISNHDASLIVVVFSVYVLISLQTGTLDSGFRCDGNYAIGNTCQNVVRLSEASLATLSVAFGHRAFVTAIVYLAARVVGFIGLMIVLRMKSPWIRYGVSRARAACIRRLAPPAFAFMAFPIGNAISLQGFTVAMGAVLGPVAVIAFSSMRTLSRVGFHVLSVIANTIWPELSAAFGAGNLNLARVLHRRACQTALVCAAACVGVLAIAGPRVYLLWTRHAVHFEPRSFDILLLVVLANSLWYTSSIVPMSTNQHGRIAMNYLIGTILSLSLAWPLMKAFGITGASSALLAIDASMVWLVLRAALQQLSDTPIEFALSMFSVPDVGIVIGPLRRWITREAA